MEETFEPITDYAEPTGTPDSCELLKGSAMNEDFIDSAQDPANLFIGRLPGDHSFALAHRSRSDGGWGLIDVLPDRDSALREAHALCRQLKHIGRARTQLYVVEHNLLRAGRRRRHDEGFVYSFTITVVVGLPWHERRNRNNRTIIEEIVRENTPAHIVADICYLDSCDLLRFERHYHSWRNAVRRKMSTGIAYASTRLRRFLERHTPRGGEDRS
jgi:hypothetical protein